MTVTKKFILFFIAFIGLSVTGIYAVISESSLSWVNLKGFFALSSKTIAICLTLSVFIFIADFIRYHLFAKTVGIQLKPMANIDAIFSNFFFSWVTPGAAFGAPAAAYMLKRHGHNWSDSLLMSFGKSLSGTSILLISTFFFLTTTEMGQFKETPEGKAIFSFLGICTFIFPLPILASFFAKKVDSKSQYWLSKLNHKVHKKRVRLSIALINAFNQSTQRMSTFTKASKKTLLLFFLSHLIYYFLYVQILVLLITSVTNEFFPSSYFASTVYTAFTFLSPTPGGSGLAEGTGPLFLKEFLSLENAVICVIFFRSLTFYLQIVVSFIFLISFHGGKEFLQLVRNIDST